ncbi:hypothetical protein FRX31_006780 [Thalictrum thalictroides]|uniref:WRC domain-containing protein n=1 Tax=Thalictrum thalictroides TaxID=46969 RepID=A0A7J6X2R7_THATH|nr:hypothetical protein FRX31_006780 [Thalictrum thalictroides]
MANLHPSSSPLQPNSPPPPPRSISKAAVPDLFYLSWGLRLLSDVASHVQRCSMCYAVEEESENVEGGWSVASPPNGSQRMSIVDNPIYLELTQDYIWFCLTCFKKCFGVTLVPPFSTHGSDFEEDSIANKAPHGLFITDEKDCSSPMGYVAKFKLDFLISGEPYVDSSSKGGRVVLVKVKKLHLNALKEWANAYLKDQDKEIVCEDPMEMMIDEPDAEDNGISNGGNSKENIIRTEKRRRKQSKPTDEQGTRCSRINGRGWQCRKTTLPNYALCEYHLGLARTRSQEIKAKNN